MDRQTNEIDGSFLAGFLKELDATNSLDSEKFFNFVQDLSVLIEEYYGIEIGGINTLDEYVLRVWVRNAPEEYKELVEKFSKFETWKTNLDDVVPTPSKDKMRVVHVEEIEVTDPDTFAPVHLNIYKEEAGGMFGVDSSYFDTEDPVHSPFGNGEIDFGDEE
jgi:hypothetical protein